MLSSPSKKILCPSIHEETQLRTLNYIGDFGHRPIFLGGAGSEGARLQRANSQRYYLLPLPLAKYPIRIAAAEHAAMHGTTGG
jgi:hypothetical protein